jgi:polyisoprenoid-binding protein YceI
MRPSITHAFAAALILTPVGIPSEQLAVQPQSKMWIEGSSTVRSFSCQVPEFNLTVNAEGTGTVTAVLGGQKAVRTVELTIPAARMDCGNGRMNEHMLKAVKAEQNPTIRFTLASYDVAKAGDGVQGTLRGSLTLGGATHPIDLSAVATDAGNGAMRIVGGYEVALSAFDLERPSLMFGRIKVGDKIQVKFDLVLKS